MFELESVTKDDVRQILSELDIQEGIGIDNQLSETSINPVMNKVITTELNKKANINMVPTKISDLELDIEIGSKYDDTEIRNELSGLSEEIKEVKVNQGPIDYGEVAHSAILKGEYESYSNRAISQTSMAVGAGTIAGLKGWYYSAIDFTNKKITLSDRPTYILVGTTLLNGHWSSGKPNIAVGDKISLVNNNKYDYCGEVASISENVITLKENLPFTELVMDNGAASAVTLGKFSDGYSLYLPDRQDAGIIDFGGGAFAEGGLESKASNICAHAEGFTTHAYGQCSHSEGRETKAGYAAHAEGNSTRAAGNASHSEGYETKADAHQAHTEGWKTSVDEKSRAGHAEGYNSHVGGVEKNLVAGSDTSAGTYSHAEGNATQAIGSNSHSEGKLTKALGQASHAEGVNTIAKGTGAHAEGVNTQALKSQSHTEGEGSIANGQRSHAEGLFTITNNHAEHAEGKYNVSNSGKTIHSVGIGASDANRKNAHEITTDGKHYILGVGNYDGTKLDGATDVATVLGEIDTYETDFTIENLMQIFGNPDLEIEFDKESLVEALAQRKRIIVPQGNNDMGYGVLSGYTDAETVYLSISTDENIYVIWVEDDRNLITGSQVFKYNIMNFATEESVDNKISQAIAAAITTTLNTEV